MKVVYVGKSNEIPSNPLDGKPTLVYWDIQGLTEAIRLSLVAAGVDFVDVRLPPGDPTSPTYKSVWFDVKEDMPLAFPNVPFFMDEKVKMSQSAAILRYVGTKYNLRGTSLHQTDEMLDILNDLYWQFVRCSYYKGTDAVINWYKTSTPVFFAKFAAMTGDDCFLFGSETATIADFQLYAFLRILIVIQDKLGDSTTASVLEDPWFQNYKKKIEEIPGLKAHVSSPQFTDSPLNTPHANWAG